MRLILNLSKDITSICKPGSGLAASWCSPSMAAPSPTHSTQISWQLHAVLLRQTPVIVAVESYSRYCLLFKLELGADQQELVEAFNQAYLAEMQWCLSHGGLVRPHQKAALSRQFRRVAEVPLLQITNEATPSLTTLAESQLRELARERSLSAADLRALATRLNQLPVRSERSSQNTAAFFPLERFLRDSLYRFAAGLCDLSLPGCKVAEFPNPHRRESAMTLVGEATPARVASGSSS